VGRVSGIHTDSLVEKTVAVLLLVFDASREAELVLDLDNRAINDGDWRRVDLRVVLFARSQNGRRSWAEPGDGDAAVDFSRSEFALACCV
jgi:hypothetical protein